MPSNPEFTAPNYTTQSASAYKANIDASIAANGAELINLGLVYSSSTLSIKDARGNDLSSTNPGFVKFNDAGLTRYVSIEDNQGFIDATGSSEIIDNLFGFPTGVAVTDDVTFGIYAVVNDARNAVAIMASRDLYAKVSPAAANIGAPDDAVAGAFGDFFSFDSLDETLYDGNPCTLIGLFRMQMSASDDWTVQALSSASDGIGYQPKATEGGWELVSASSASGGSTIEFDLPTEYKEFKIILNAVNFSTNADGFYIRLSSDGGSTWKTGYCGAGFKAYQQNYSYYLVHAAYGYIGSGMKLADYIRDGGGLCGEVDIYHAADSSRYVYTRSFLCHGHSNDYNDQAVTIRSGTQGGGADKINYCQLFSDLGNLTTGTFELYGRKVIYQ